MHLELGEAAEAANCRVRVLTE